MRISVEQAIQLLQAGQVVAMPTETVYGLAACLHLPAAVERIFALKGRPLTNPLIIHVASQADVLSYAQELPPQFEVLTQAFWPGPLTLIVPIQTDLIPSLVRAQLPTAGFRMPNHSLTLQVIQATGPLVMPSANLSGRPSSTKPEHVEADFGAAFPVLDGGSCQKGLESTILYYDSPRWTIVRLGALPAEAFAPILDYQPDSRKAFKHVQPLCPGQLFRHYAPLATLVLGDSVRLPEADYVVGFRERVYPADKRVLDMGSLENPQEVAENLYEVLRQLDREGAKIGWVDMDFPRNGLWETIAERLLRAGEKTNQT